MQDCARPEFLGITFDPLDTEEALPELEKLLASDEFSYVVTPNVDHLVQLHKKPVSDPLWEVYRGADLCLCDSRILQFLAKWSGVALPLAPGSDLTARLLQQPLAGNPSVAVVGGDPMVVDQLRGLRPELTWYHHAPPMGVRSNPAAQAGIIEFVEQVDAPMVFFAIGAPQSELLCRALALRANRGGVGLCIGASLEFITGKKKRAPGWMQQARLEWLFRLGSEPRRLARRYLVEGPRILSAWARWLRHRRQSHAACGSSSSAER